MTISFFSAAAVTVCLSTVPAVNAQVAAEFFRSAGSQSNGLRDFETERSPGQVFRAEQTGLLTSLELVLSDFSNGRPPEIQTDCEIRIFRWDGNTVGPLLATAVIEHEDIPDGLQFSEPYTIETIDFSLDPGAQLYAGEDYAWVASLVVPFTPTNLGFPGTLGLAASQGDGYASGEAILHNADGSIIIFGGAVPPLGEEGILDFFFRANIDPDSISTDLDNSGGDDFFDVLEFVELADAGDDLADLDDSGSIDAADITMFLSRLQ